MADAERSGARPLSEVLAEVLDQLDKDDLRDYMTNQEIARWMAQEVIDRGITVIG